MLDGRMDMWDLGLFEGMSAWATFATGSNCAADHDHVGWRYDYDGWRCDYDDDSSAGYDHDGWRYDY